jgi:hypothetical protein
LKMTADAATIEAGRPPETGGKGKTRLLTLEDLDGRTRAAQHVKETRAEVCSDLGGEDRLSALERAAVDHVSLLDAMIKDVAARWLMGESIEVASIATLVNAFNRSAGVLGWQRRPRDVTPSLHQLLAMKESRK